MKKYELIPQKLTGCVKIPPSKSISHRALICAGLSNRVSRIENILLSEDIVATCKAMEAMGASIEKRDEDANTVTLIVSGNGGNIQLKKSVIDCVESGSTLRFILPLLALTGEETGVTGKGRLAERPLKPYMDIFKEQNISCNCEKQGKLLPLKINGRLNPGQYRLPGDVSSQFVSGLLFALPLLKGDSQITMTSGLESEPYVEITREELVHYGIKTYKTENGYSIPGSQNYKSCDRKVEGDFSQAAFWLVAGVLGSDLQCLNLPPVSVQGDFAIIKIIENMGGKCVYNGDALIAKPSRTIGTTIDVTDYPDLLPVLAVLAALSKGHTTIIGATRLRYKESDRLKAISDALQVVGGHVKETKDGLKIEGVSAFTGGIVNSVNDHRIAMAMAIASTRSTSPIVIEGAEAVKKSYPHFFEDFVNLGGEVHELNLG